MSTSSAALYLLDTNIISHLMRDAGSPSAQRCRAALAARPESSFAISVVVQCELAYGLARRPSLRLQAAHDALLAQLPVLPLTPAVVTHYARLRTHLEQQGTPIGPNDMLIAAHALACHAILVTADAEFARVPHLQWENWLSDV